MPLPEVAGGIAGGLEGLGDRGLLRPDRMAPLETPETIWVPACHHAAPRRRADRGGGVEAVEPQGLRRELVEIRCLQDAVAVVGHVTPALVVRHAQYDIGLAL